MEEDGNYDVNFEWGFQLLTCNNKPKAPFNMYNRPGPCLKRGVATSFTTAMQCLGKCGHMDIQFFRCIAAKSNQYACEHMDQTMLCFGGSKCNNIQLEEMIHFFGMVLKMSINDRRVGGYTEYFYDEVFTDLAEDTQSISMGAKDVTALHHFK